jgi:hypothetical protein
MRIYAVYHGKQCAGSVSVQDDGHITWEVSPAGQDLGLDEDKRTMIAQVINHAPNAVEFTVAGFTMRKRAPSR